MNSSMQTVRIFDKRFDPFKKEWRYASMRRLSGVFFLFCCFQLSAQSGSRWFFTLGPSLSVGNRFEGGVTTVSAPDITGAHHIRPLFSPLWGFPNPQYSGAENLGRKLHLGMQYERFFNPAFALVTGVELGSRGYIIQSDFSNDLLVSYRTVGVPLYASFSSLNGNFWTLRQNAGFQFLYATSIPERIKGTIELFQKRSLSPQIYLGLELIHKSFSAPFSFEVSYSHGFTDLIDHYYLGVDYVTPIQVKSNGSAWRFTIKYLFKEKADPLDIKEMNIELDAFDLLAYRNVKEASVIKVTSDSIRICVEDDQTVDGDSVAVEFNQRLIHPVIMIEREPYCFELVLIEGAANTLIIHALNEGKIPPNTCVIHVYFGEEHKEVRLKSDLQNSGAIRFEH
ncbi:MAG: porin family protein [Bacteroidia bacterium]